MIKIRGRKEDVNRFLEISEEVRKANNEDTPVFDDVSSTADRENGITDLYHKGNFILEFVQRVSNELPELKIYGYRYDIAWNGRTYFWSKAGSSHLEIIEIGSFNPYAEEESYEPWWDKEDVYYTEENPDGSLSIVGYYRWDEELHIPEIIDGKPVTGLTDKLFYGNPVVKDIYVGNNITSVGTTTFSSCQNLVLHTDNPVILNALKRTNVMIASADDSEETLNYKRELIYKQTVKGITVYAYRGNEKDVRIPDTIEQLPVNKIAQNAFSAKQLHSLVLPSAITQFVPEIFGKGEVECLAAPGIDFSTVRSITWKQALARGFLLMNQEGLFKDEKITDSYAKYLKNSVSQYIEPCINDVRLLQGLLKTVKLSPDSYETLLKYAVDKDNTEAIAILLDYKNENISEENMEKSEKQKLSVIGKAPSLSKIKKDWGYKVQDDDTIAILSYKGSDTDVIIPSVIEEKPVVEIGETAFNGVCYYTESQVVKNVKVRRQQINTVYIPSSVKKISEIAFIGCGDRLLGEYTKQYIISPKKAKKAYLPKMMLIVEKGSYAEKYAEKEKMNYQIT